MNRCGCNPVPEQLEFKIKNKQINFFKSTFPDLYPLNNREYQYIEAIKSNCITNSKSKGNKEYFGWNAEVN